MIKLIIKDKYQVLTWNSNQAHLIHNLIFIAVIQFR